MIPHVWDCTTDYCELLLPKWQAPTNQRRDPNPKRITALAHTLPLLDDEQLYHLYAVGLAAWKEQEFVRWPEEEPAPWNFSGVGTVWREEQETAIQSVYISATGTKHTTKPIANKASTRCARTCQLTKPQLRNT